MIPQEFLYFLLDDQGNSYYLNNGVVDKTSTPVPLETSPDGWMSTSIKWERNIRYFGAFRSFTTPYKFVKKAAKIIRTRFYKYGIEDRLYLVILWLDKTFGGGWTHKKLFKGECDLSQVEDDLTSITVPIAEGDLYKLFKANETTTYSIPIVGPTVFDDGILLFETGNMQVLDGIQMVFAGPGDSDLQVVNVPMIVSSTEGRSSGILFINQELDSSVDTHFAEAQANNTGPVLLNLKGDLFFTVDANSRDVLQLSFRKSTESSLGGGILVFNDHVPAVNTFSCTFDITVTMNPGEKLILDALALGTGPFKMTFLPNSKFKASFSNQYKTTYTPVMRPADLAQALVTKITGSPLYIFKSDYLSTTWDNLTITSGDAIRGIKDPVIKISIQQLFDSLNVPCVLSMRIDGRFMYFEPQGSAFDSTVVMDLGEVRDLKISADKDFQYNKLAIGYPDLDQSTYESLNAKEEFNVTSRFTTNATRVNNELNLVSFIHGSMYEQELARANLDGKDTTAASVDDTVFFKHIEKNPAGTVAPTILTWYYINYTSGVKYFVNTTSGFYDPSGIAAPPPFPATVDFSALVFVAVGFTDLVAYLTGNPSYPGWDGSINSTTSTSTITSPPVTSYYRYLRPTFDSVTGLLSPETAYNLLISPMNCLLNHGAFLRSVFHWQEMSSLVFQTSNQQTTLKTVKGSVTVDERASPNIGSLASPLFVPITFDFSAPMKREIVTTMKNTPAGTFSFNWLGNTYYGFVKEIAIQPANRPAQETKLICSPQSDILKLIH